MFQSYRAFASKWYKILILLAYPLCAILCCILLQYGVFGMKGYHFLLTSSLMTYFIIFIECIADSRLFSGIQSKHVNHMDLLKSSKKGMAFFRNALLSDVIRRFFTIALCNGVNVVIGVLIFDYKLDGINTIFEIIIYALCCYFFSTFGVFLSRFGDNWWLNVAAGYGGSAIALGVLFFGMKLDIPLWMWIAIYSVLSILVTILAIVFALKKVEDSYYDQRS